MTDETSIDLGMIIVITPHKSVAFTIGEKKQVFDIDGEYSETILRSILDMLIKDKECPTTSS